MKTNRQNNPCSSCSLAVSCLPFSSGDGLSCVSGIIQETLVLDKGENLYRQQEKFRGLYSIKSGGMKTFVLNEAGEDVVTSFFLAGEIMGIDAIYAERYQENAVALAKTEICRIPFNALLDMAAQDRHVQHELFRMFSYRVHQMTHHWHLNAEQKVASFLLDYAHRLMRQRKSGSDFTLLPTQQDIASFLGLTPETISRVFRKFLDQGVYQSPRVKQIQSLNHQLLHNMIEGE